MLFAPAGNPTAPLKIKISQTVHFPILKQIMASYLKSQSHLWSNDPSSKLYVPLVIQHAFGYSLKMGLSQHALCCGLHIYENYCQIKKIKMEMSTPEDAYLILQACLDISQSVDGNRGKDQKKQLTKRQRLRETVKLDILVALKWKVNVVSFVDVSGFFMDMVSEVVKNGSIKVNLEQQFKKQVQKIIFQCDFIKQSPFISAQIVIKKLLAKFNLQLPYSLQTIISRNLQIIQLKEVKPQQSLFEQTKRQTLIPFENSFNFSLSEKKSVHRYFQPIALFAKG